MVKPMLALATLGAAAPALMGAAGVPVPSGMPDWLPWLLSALGPLAVFLGGFGLRALTAALRARAKAIRTDKDKTNDTQAPVLEAIADVIDQTAQKKGLE